MRKSRFEITIGYTTRYSFDIGNAAVRVQPTTKWVDFDEPIGGLVGAICLIYEIVVKEFDDYKWSIVGIGNDTNINGIDSQELNLKPGLYEIIIDKRSDN